MYEIKYESNASPNSNSSSNAGKKRVRASQACVHCRKKKIKCDENRPDCTQCQEANVVCEYTEPKKRGPRKGYVQLLEERLAQMERKLMGPNPEYHQPSSNYTSDDDNIKSASTPASNQAHSPIQFYENPDHTADLPPIDVVNQLVDLFFKYINSIFPLVHRSVLKKSIQDGSVSRPLLYSVLAIGARFSENPSIRTDPPYLAGERYAEKALSLVDANTLQPNLENIQFWGIMSCLEYGRASGSKSWIYGGLAVRFCQELEFHKEETLSVPILADDGSIDTVAMALRRRVYWSCLSIDKLSSAGTHRPQCIERSDCDANIPNIPECLVLRDPIFHRNSEGKSITEDSLMNVAKYYLRILESYGEVNKYMYRAKSNSASIVWPPIPEFRNLDTQLRSWQDTLPDLFQFNEKNLNHHRLHASANYLNTWLCAHAIWCSSMMILHRGSLAFSDLKQTDSIAEDLYRRIQSSVDTCRVCVDAAMGIFEAIKDYCGYNTLPYIGYSAYVFSTLLMTSTFSNTPESCKKSSQCLKILSELIDGMRPYWPMCERLSNATRELLVVHQKLYQQDIQSYVPYSFEQKPNKDLKLELVNNRSPVISRSPSSHSSSSFTMSPVQVNRQHTDTPPLSSLLGNTTTTSEPAIMPPYQQQQMPNGYKLDGTPSTSTANTNYFVPSNTGFAQQRPSTRGNEIDFNSLEFLYDTGLFGQVVFDVNNTMPVNPYSTQPQSYMVYSSPASTPTNSAFQTIIPPQASSQTPQSPSTSFNSKSLWS